MPGTRPARHTPPRRRIRPVRASSSVAPRPRLIRINRALVEFGKRFAVSFDIHPKLIRAGIRTLLSHSRAAGLYGPLGGLRLRALDGTKKDKTATYLSLGLRNHRGWGELSQQHHSPRRRISCGSIAFCSHRNSDRCHHAASAVALQDPPPPRALVSHIQATADLTGFGKLYNLRDALLVSAHAETVSGRVGW